MLVSGTTAARALAPPPPPPPPLLSPLMEWLMRYGVAAPALIELKSKAL